MKETIIRKGEEKDLPSVLELIRELAFYERAPEEVSLTLQQLREDGFGKKPQYMLTVAEIRSEIVGMALYYNKYSTWKGKCIFLEDIIVKEKYRRQAVGSLLFKAVIRYCERVFAKRLEWQVLDWNRTAIDFYGKFGARFSNEWLNGRIVLVRGYPAYTS